METEWLIPDGCQLIISSPHGPLFRSTIADLAPVEIVRWIRPAFYNALEEHVPDKAYRLVIQEIPLPG
jgi:hypothetical protein